MEDNKSKEFTYLSQIKKQIKGHVSTNGHQFKVLGNVAFYQVQTTLTQNQVFVGVDGSYLLILS